MKYGKSTWGQLRNLRVARDHFCGHTADMLCQACGSEFFGLCPNCSGLLMHSAIADMRRANSRLVSEKTEMRMIAVWLLAVLVRQQKTATATLKKAGLN